MTPARLGNLFFFIILVQLLSGCSGSGQKTYRFLHNNDGTDLLGNRWCDCRPLTVEDLDRNIDLVVDSPVTTFMMCSGSDIFYYESAYGRVMGDDLGGLIPIGHDTVQFRTCHEYYLNFIRLKSQGVDFLGHIFERVRSAGKEIFITYRMNDLHFSSMEEICPLARPDVMIQHPDWLINDGNVQGWHSAGGLDFALDAVRNRKIAIITEQLENYGSLIDGFEMDFLRFPVFFKPGEGPSRTACMTDMMEKVRSKVDSMSSVLGRKLMLAVRIPSSVENNLKLGIDIREWLSLGLVDFVTMGSYWRGNPSMPVQQFREELGDCLNVPLYACVDDGGYDKREPWSQGQFRGMCSNILSQGADGVYLFNFYFGEWFKRLRSGNLSEEGGPVLRSSSPEMLNELGTLKSLEGRNKIYLLSDGKKEYVLSPATPLPISLVSGERREADLFIGDKVDRKRPVEAILFVRAEGEIKVNFNGQALTVENPSYPALFDKNRNLEDNFIVHAYIVDPSVLMHGNNRISFSSGTDAVVKRLELALKYGGVEDCGYF